MKKLIILLLIFFLIIPSNIKGIEVNSDCIVVMDSSNNRVLYSKNKDKKRLIASITKIMTAIVVIENTNLEDKVVVDDIITKSIGSNVYLEINEEITIKDLLYGLMLRSGNDAALVLSKKVSGSEEEFVKLMNSKASELGMLNTVFSNPHGLDNINENISSAYDMALLSSYSSKNIDYMQIVGTKKHKATSNFKSYIWYNKNKLLSNKFVTGGKTGFTEKARRTLVSTASNNNIDLTIVTLNDGDDFKNHAYIYDNIYKNYINYKLLDTNNFYVKDDNFYKDKLYINNNFYYSLNKDEINNIKSVVELEQITNYQDNNKVGVNKIYLGNELIHIEDIYISKDEVKKENIFTKVWNWIFNNDK